MRTTFSITAAALALLAAPSAAQTWSECNPLSRSDCPPNPALGRSISVDLRNGASSDFIPSFNPPYDKANGAVLSVTKSGEAPQLTSKWYIMFGKVSVRSKAAPGAGIVSSIVLQSDTRDEIDWEWLGADPAQVQSNYFSKGDDSVYNRGAFHADPSSQSQFKTYTLEWTASQVVWQIDGVTVRVLRASDVGSKFPQSPMQLKIGSWSGGDSKNAPGTIEWAKGPTDYSKGPFSMYVTNVFVQDYSTGTQYKYGDNSGSWQSIQAIGGKVNPGSGAVENAPPITSTATGEQPQPFTSSVTRPSVYPWVQTERSSAVPTTTITSYPGLPSGWTVNSSGRTIPPSSAPSPSPTDSSSSSQAQPSEGSSSEGASDSTRTLATRVVSQTGPASSNTAPPNAPPNAAPRMLAGSGLVAGLAAMVGYLMI